MTKSKFEQKIDAWLKWKARRIKVFTPSMPMEIAYLEAGEELKERIRKMGRNKALERC